MVFSKDESRECDRRGCHAYSVSSSSLTAVFARFLGENLNVSGRWSGSDCCGTVCVKQRVVSIGKIRIVQGTTPQSWQVAVAASSLCSNWHMQRDRVGQGRSVAAFNGRVVSRVTSQF
jgi:hypothetical protein